MRSAGDSANSDSNFATVRTDGRRAPPTAATSRDGASAKPPRLLDQVRARMRRLGMAIRSQDAYVGWIHRFILANGKRHPRELGEREVEAFLTDLAVRRNVAASTQNQALSSLLFLYREILGIELLWMDGIRRAKGPERLPAVLGREEVRATRRVERSVLVAVRLLYGSGLRLMECLRLRVKGVDFARHEIVVREGKGGRGVLSPLDRGVS